MQSAAEAAAVKRPHEEEDPAAGYSCSPTSTPATGKNTGPKWSTDGGSRGVDAAWGRRTGRQVLTLAHWYPVTGEHTGPEVNSVVLKLRGAEEAAAVSRLKPPSDTNPARKHDKAAEKYTQSGKRTGGLGQGKRVTEGPHKSKYR
ncbi:Hypothetical predicted protein [Pelobates cultripes]|uniref:Uncharacterized protein n=1 Tax=Pelobates cultripes TaxID=61616 RepID=A0AAD1TQI4_PELCU|nr:Hypothetical predicted protein [Pelobates cultripes]